MKRNTRLWLSATTMAALVISVATPSAWAAKLDEADIHIEINDTDGDAGIQIFLDAEGWRKMVVRDPDRNVILHIQGAGSVGFQGITELFLESAEPSFDEQPLGDFLALFPAGIYRFRGRTTDGRRLRGRAELTHILPAAPILIFPVGGEEVDPKNAVFMWFLVPDPAGGEIVGYHVVVECEEPDLVKFEVDVGPAVDSITVPPEFLVGEECKWEVLATEESGNQTISEDEFEIDWWHPWSLPRAQLAESHRSCAERFPSSTPSPVVGCRGGGARA